MKPRRSNQRNQALTLVEVIIIIAILAIAVSILLPSLAKMKNHQSRINCVNCLHQIGTAYYVWADGHNDKFPFQVPNADGGAMELVATGNVAASFRVMSNELSTPIILHCPEDTDRARATNFLEGFDNSRTSYFVGLDASTNSPQVFLSGDDNLAINGVPIKSGLLELSTNTPVAWTAARHKHAGNILFADGSVLKTDDKLLIEKLQATGVATNCLAIP